MIEGLSRAMIQGCKSDSNELITKATKYSKTHNSINCAALTTLKTCENSGTIRKKFLYISDASRFSFNVDKMCSIAGNKNMLESKPESAPELLRFALYVLPPKYPYTIFQPNNAKEMKQLMNDAPSGSILPRIQYELLENGLWKVICLDLRAVTWFMKEVATWVYFPSESMTEYSLKVLPDHLMPKLVGLSCVVRQPISIDDFLTTANNQKYWNSSKWIIAQIEDINDGNKIFFHVDPMSFRAIYFSALFIDVRDENVQVNVENNPFAAEFD